MRKTLPCLFLICSLYASSQSYQKLHNKAILIDTHNDFPSASIAKKVMFDNNLEGKTHSDLNRMQKGGVDVQVFSIFCGPDQNAPYSFANRQIDSVYAWANRNPSKMVIVKNSNELSKAVKQKKLAAMMGVEGGHMLENKLDNLDSLHQRGVRYLTLTWNNSTSWATSAADEEEKGDSLAHKGLTQFGKEVVKKMNSLGMLVDISHTGEQTFWDVINTTTKPIIASHSSVWTLCPHRRNLKDEQIKAIAKNGGVIHLNFYAGFLDSTYEKKKNEFKNRHNKEIQELIAQNTDSFYAEFMVAEKYKKETDSLRPPLSLLIDHLDYIVNLVGVDHVGLGSDFDGFSAPPLELDGVQNFALITKALRQRGYSKKEIRKILGENFIRIFRKAQSK